MVSPIESFFTPELSRQLVTLVIPFLIFFIVLLFALKKTRILGDNNFVYILIALGLTVMISVVNPGNVFQFLASYLFQIGVAGSIIALGGVIIFFFIGVIRWGHQTAKRLGGDEERLKDVRKEMEKLSKKFSSRGFLGIGGADVGQREQVLRRLEELEREERLLLAKRRRMG